MTGCRIAIGAGKGGVGKSFVTANLGMTLAKLGYKVLLVDFDLTCANLHSALGMEPTEKNLARYFSEQISLSELTSNTSVPSLSIIQGFWDQWSPFQPSSQEVEKFLKDLPALPYDFVLLDLGPGATSANLQIFSTVEERILVTTPEPTSVEKTYRFIEAHVWHRLRLVLPEKQHEQARKFFCEFRSLPKRSDSCAVQFLQQKLANPGITSSVFVDTPHQSPVRLLINEARNSFDQNLGFSIKSVCNKFFGLAVSEMGSLDYDNAIWQAVRAREPFLVSKPFTPISGQLLGIAKSLVREDLHAQILRAAI